VIPQSLDTPRRPAVSRQMAHGHTRLGLLGSRLLPTTRLTLVPAATCVPPRGDWEVTTPGLLQSKMGWMLPGFKPTARNAANAELWELPVTSGTAMVVFGGGVG
jgi:hypothetical protein